MTDHGVVPGTRDGAAVRFLLYDGAALTAVPVPVRFRSGSPSNVNHGE